MARYIQNNQATGLPVQSSLNTELQKIETAINDTLSRKGDSPNAMEADLDMNSNDILNASSIDTQTLRIKGVDVTVAAPTNQVDYDSTQELINGKPDINSWVRTAGYAALGDQGSGVWYHNGVTNQTASQSPGDLGDILLNDANGNQWKLIHNGTINAQAIGVLGETDDGLAATVDYSNQLQALHDALANDEGGIVNLPGGKIGFSSTLYFGEGQPVLFVGKGRGALKNSKVNYRKDAGTRLSWTGLSNGDGIIITSNRNDDGTKVSRFGGGIVDVMIDGQESGGKGLQVISHNGHDLKVTLCYWTDIMFKSSCLANGHTDGPADNQRFRWNIHTGDANTTNEPNTHVVIHGNGTDGSANTSLGVIDELKLSPESTAVAADFGDFDGTVIKSLIAATRDSASGDGGKVFFHSDDSLPAYAGSNAGFCRRVTILFAQCPQGIVSKGITTGTNAAGPNWIPGLSRGNGGATPTVESGSEMYWSDDSGYSSINGHLDCVIGDSEAKIDQARANLNTESLRVINNASDHLKFEAGNGTAVWGINVNQATGDLRILRNLGSGEVEIGRAINTTVQYRVDGTQVVSNRITGWSTPSGTATRTGFATSTATTQQVAEALKALIEDLKIHGLIGN